MTIALHSAKLAADLLGKQLKGEAVDWQTEFADQLMIGVNAFRTYVNGWYDFRFQNAIYAPNRSPEISRMIFVYFGRLRLGYEQSIRGKIRATLIHTCRIGGRFEGRIRTNAFQTAAPKNRTGRLKIYPHH